MVSINIYGIHEQLIVTHRIIVLMAQFRGLA